ncbi:MAG: sulfotransferase domain-containing protein [Cyanobacteria bacterium J06621_15]
MEAKELSLIPQMNCIPRSFDLNAPENFYTPIFITKNGMQNVLNHFVSRDSDIYVATYPKSGTTWTISITEHLMDKVPEQGISTGASNVELCLWLDRTASGENWRTRFSELDKMKSPRFFKSHASVGLIKKPARIIQCIRHPLDTFVSAWHHIRGKKHLFYYNGLWSHFFSEIALSSKYECGDWFDYHEEFLRASEAGQIDALFLRYEKMKKDNAISAIHELAEFIGIESYNAEEISGATDFQSMKQKSLAQGHLDTEGNLSNVLVSQEIGDKDSPSNAHIRKGIVGDWMNYLSNEELDMWRDYVSTKKDSCPRVVNFFSLDNLLCYQL